MPVSTEKTHIYTYSITLSIDYVIELLEEKTKMMYCGASPEVVADDKTHEMYVYIHSLEY